MSTRVLAEKLADSLSGPIPVGTPRSIHGDVLLEGKATAIIGMRRSGKTMFMHELRRQFVESGLPRNGVPYINFEDERLLDLDPEDLTFLLNEFERSTGNEYAGETAFICLDEIQLVRGWEKFVRRLLDMGRYRVAVSGSSADMLSREIATSLRGRAWQVTIFPFSFREKLVHLDQASLLHEMPSLTHKSRMQMEGLFREWLLYGGFPEAQGLRDETARRLLSDYVDVAILRDVVERHEVSNVTGLRWLTRHLLGNAASSFSVNKFHGALKSQGIAISRDTVHELLGYLEDSFLVRLIWMESTSVRQRQVNPRKAYPIDTGLIRVFDRSGKHNVGHVLETAVLIELERRGAEVSWVRTVSEYEVDFLARLPNGDVELIQVCAEFPSPGTVEREVRALLEAQTEFPEAVPRLLTLTADHPSAGIPEAIVVQPAYEWMLQHDSGAI